MALLGMPLLPIRDESSAGTVLTHSLVADHMTLDVGRMRRLRIPTIEHTWRFPSSWSPSLSRMGRAIGKVNARPFLGAPAEALLLTNYERSAEGSCLKYIEQRRGWNSSFHPRRGWRRSPKYKLTSFQDLFWD